MKHEILSWNAFALVSKFHYAFFSSIKKTVFTENISDSENLMAWNKINSKRPRRIWMKS